MDKCMKEHKVTSTILKSIDFILLKQSNPDAYKLK